VLTAAQLERAVGAYRRVTTREANDLHANAHLVTFWDEDGALVIRGRLAPEDGALFLRGLEAARDSLWSRRGLREDGSAEPRPTNAEAAVAMADASLAAGHVRSGGERYQVVVHVDADTLTKEGEAGCVLDDGAALAPETARRLACDASVVAISERNGKNAARRSQDVHDPTFASPRLECARPWLPLPRLQQPPFRRRPPRAPLGPWRRDGARQPRAPLPPS
jgi:hypothetical protein